jgi:CoA:oxalate CoA-transferase
VGGEVHYRQVTGEGQRLDIAMLDAQISLMTYRAQYYFLEKVIPEPIGSGHVSAVPIRAFKAKDGKYLTIDAAQDKFFQGVCQVLGIEAVGKDPRFNSRSARLRNRDALMEILEDKFAGRNRDKWLDLLIKADVPAGPVNNLAEALSDPSVSARNMVVSVDHLGEEIQMVGNPIKMSKITEEVFKGAPSLGQHTDEILSRYLGYTPEQIAKLRADKVL